MYGPGLGAAGGAKMALARRRSLTQARMLWCVSCLIRSPFACVLHRLLGTGLRYPGTTFL